MGTKRQVFENEKWSIFKSKEKNLSFVFFNYFTDMNDVTIFVNHNVAVMSILDLQQETEDTVGRHRGYKIAPRSFETLTTFVTKFLVSSKIQNT